MRYWIYFISLVIICCAAFLYWRSLTPLTLPAVNEYEKAARASGGQVWQFNKSHDETAKNMAKHAIQSLYESNRYSLIWISAGIVDENNDEIRFDAEPHIKTISIFISGLTSSPIFKVSGPSGKNLSPDDLLISDQSQTQIFKSPSPGPWKIKILNKDNLSIQVRGETDFFLEDPEPIRLGGRLGHEGFFPYKGILKPGTKEKFSFQWPSEWNIKKSWFSVISLNGRLLSRNQTDKEVEIPNEPFRIRLEWEDHNGQTGQRMALKVFELNRLELVEFHQRFEEIPKSETCHLLQSSSHWTVFTDTKSAASVSINCLLENFNGVEKWYSAITLYLPWDPQKKMTLTNLLSADYRKLSPRECELAKDLFSSYPRPFKNSSGHSVDFNFSCVEKSSGLQGVLTAQVFSP